MRGPVSARFEHPAVAMTWPGLALPPTGLRSPQNTSRWGFARRCALSGQVIVTEAASGWTRCRLRPHLHHSRRYDDGDYPLGYADGVPRHASSAGPVVIGEQRFQVAGRVSMDQISIDVGDHSVAVGQWAVLWGTPQRATRLQRNGLPCRAQSLRSRVPFGLQGSQVVQ